MTRLAAWLLTAGVLLFIGVLVSQGLPAVLTTLGTAGWGLLLVAAFHLLPLSLDAGAIRVLYPRRGVPHPARDALLARWVGEAGNSLMPAGQLGGPVLMARHLARRGMRMDAAAAVITVSTTLQTFAQILFALLGVALLGAHSRHASGHALRTTVLIASGFLGLQIVGFYFVQRNGVFGRVLRLVERFAGKRDWSVLRSKAVAIDQAIEALYARGGRLAASFALSLAGWLAGAGEVFLILQFIGHPVDLSTSLLLESLGQAIRGAAFAVPGALGVQESGYLLLAPLAGLTPETALALSLAKRTRELLLGVPGLIYLRLAGRAGDAAVRPLPP